MCSWPAKLTFWVSSEQLQHKYVQIEIWWQFFKGGGDLFLVLPKHWFQNTKLSVVKESRGIPEFSIRYCRVGVHLREEREGEDDELSWTRNTHLTILRQESHTNIQLFNLPHGEWTVINKGGKIWPPQSDHYVLFVRLFRLARMTFYSTSLSLFLFDHLFLHYTSNIFVQACSCIHVLLRVFACCVHASACMCASICIFVRVFVLFRLQ